MESVARDDGVALLSIQSDQQVAPPSPVPSDAANSTMNSPNYISNTRPHLRHQVSMNATTSGESVASDDGESDSNDSDYPLSIISDYEQDDEEEEESSTAKRLRQEDERQRMVANVQEVMQFYADTAVISRHRPRTSVNTPTAVPASYECLQYLAELTLSKGPNESKRCGKEKRKKRTMEQMVVELTSD